jgi:hypothetical protein
VEEAEVATAEGVGATGGQEGAKLADPFGRGPGVVGDLGAELGGPGALGCPLGHRGANQAGRDCEYRDSEFASLGGERFDETEEPGLAAGIGGEIGAAAQRAAAAERDDAAAPADDHAGQQGARAQERAIQVDFQGASPGHGVDFPDRPHRFVRAGARHQQVDRPQSAFAFVRDPRHRLRVGHVARRDEHPSAGRFDLGCGLPELGLGAGHDGHGGAGRRQGSGDPAPDPPPAAGDQRDLPAEIGLVDASLLRSVGYVGERCGPAPLPDLSRNALVSNASVNRRGGSRGERGGRPG